MIQQYQNEAVVLYHSAKHGLTIEESQNIFSQLKMFLQESVQKEGNEPSPEVDACWHSFILHTEAYYNFCAEYLGKFIHHYPHFEPAQAKSSADFECGCETGTRPVDPQQIYTHQVL